MKLTGTKKILGGVALAGALALTGIVGFAQQKQTQDDGGQARAGRQWGREGRGDRKGRHGKGGMFGGRFAEKLNLTDAQKQQIEQIKARFQESTKAMREQGRGTRGDRDDFMSGTFNESAVRAAAQARANRHVEMEVARARMMSEIYNVLTAEQKTQLATERQQREQRRQEWRARSGGQTQDN
ncbi:MAG: Spy/CpxP family protein refolding chaperone [Acidobacteria bacterium]|nr:Spy/CpxP family protein refolding chaperone [Acidobacteriota bacterium]